MKLNVTGFNSWHSIEDRIQTGGNPLSYVYSI